MGVQRKVCANHTFVGCKDIKAWITRVSGGGDTQKWEEATAQREAPAFSLWMGGRCCY